MNKVIFENLPSRNTPINAQTLNAIQNTIEQELALKFDKADYEKIGTEENPINANELVEVGTYKISGEHINFYNTRTPSFVCIVTYNGTTLVQSVVTEDGLVARTGTYENDSWNFSDWKEASAGIEEYRGTAQELVDLDDITTVGIYKIISPYYTNTPYDNLPVIEHARKSFILIVNGNRQQCIVDVGGLYTRYFNSLSTINAWTEWKLQSGTGCEIIQETDTASTDNVYSASAVDNLKQDKIKFMTKQLTTDTYGNISLNMSSDNYRILNVVPEGNSINGWVTTYCFNNIYHIHTGNFNGTALSGTATFRITYIEL